MGCRPALYAAAERLQIDLSSDLCAQIESGFGPTKAGEDSFDAFVGLLGLIEVLRGNRETGLPQDDRILQVEGWILGQKTRLLSPASDRLRPLDVVAKKEKGRRARENADSQPASRKEAGQDAGGSSKSLSELRSAASKKAWETLGARDDQEALTERRNEASRKAWATMRAKKAQE